jgi:hypothetical protein
MSNGQEYNPWLAGAGPDPKQPVLTLGKTAPLTAEVQQREEMTAANEALLAAAKEDQARREGILQDAQTAGRRQAAEGMLQATRGMAVGTGATAAMGRQAAADALMQEQQIAAQQAAMTPAFDIASLEKQMLAEQQAAGTLMTDRQGKITSYWEQINAFDPDDKSGARDATINALIQNEFGQVGPDGQPAPDWFMINWLNSMLSEPNPAFNMQMGSEQAPIGSWYLDPATGQWTMNQIGPDGQVVSQTSEEKPAGAHESMGEWVEHAPGWWKRNTVAEDGTVKTEYHKGDTPPGEEAGEGAEEEDDGGGMKIPGAPSGG